MNPRAARWALALLAGAALPLVLALTGLSRMLGAHPWWDVKTSLIGAALGLVATPILLPASRKWRLLAGLILLAVAAGAAHYGKTRFAASFAEDALAGRLWYFGWIGIAAGLTLACAAALSPTKR